MLIIAALGKIIHPRAIQSGIGSVLIGGQQGFTMRQDLAVILRDGIVGAGRDERVCHRLGGGDHQPSDHKGQPVHVRLHAVQLYRAVNRLK